MSLPDVVSRDEWLVARKQLLANEKEFTRKRDALNAERRRLPMVKIDKDYVFEGPDVKASLLDLFDGRRQLIVQHFMFDPSWDDGCPSCSWAADEISTGRLEHLHTGNTTFVAVSRARQDRGLQGPSGLELPLVLLARQRLQLRLPRHARRVGRTCRIQLPLGVRARTGRHRLLRRGGATDRDARLQLLPA
jgi:hypothetical protein